MIIRRECLPDFPAVQELTQAAFGRTLERDLLNGLRQDQGWLPALSLVAEHDSTIIGHVVCTRGDVDGADGLGLGPLSVAPPAQHQGIGAALMHAVCAVAEACGERLVVLLGEPAYYARFGFVAASALGVTSPEPTWGQAFQARRLSEDAPTGAFRYARPFHDL